MNYWGWMEFPHSDPVVGHSWQGPFLILSVTKGTSELQQETHRRTTEDKTRETHDKHKSNTGEQTGEQPEQQNTG